LLFSSRSPDFDTGRQAAWEGFGSPLRCKGCREADFAIYFLLDGAPKRKQPLVDKDE